MPDAVKKTVALVLGGVRSGKSRWALEFAARGRAVAFLATAEALDDEMRARIARHRAERPAGWTTVETPLALPEAIEECGRSCDLLVVDCLTLWTANLLTAEQGDRDRILAHADRLCAALARTAASVVLVSNEVGWGIVPADPETRLYRDLLGEINQRVARVADQVVLLVAGCPVQVKPAPGGAR
jgi:adenosylcobinamide kinase/adenosylcobinamide-phosphate guanylyltransferase